MHDTMLRQRQRQIWLLGDIEGRREEPQLQGARPNGRAEAGAARQRWIQPRRCHSMRGKSNRRTRDDLYFSVEVSIVRFAIIALIM
jgi:hypothetical protein